MVNLYALLGIPLSATVAEIEAALARYRQQSGADARVVEGVRSWLLNPAVRLRYDQKLREFLGNGDAIPQVEPPPPPVTPASAAMPPSPPVMPPPFQGARSTPPPPPPQSPPAAAATAYSEEDWQEAALGYRNTDYYREAFARVGAGAHSWNWAAFFGGFVWLLYRAMPGRAAASVVLPWVSLMAATFIAVVLRNVVGGAAVLVVWLWLALWLLLRLVWLPRRANAWYQQTVQEKIARARRSGGAGEAQMQRLVRQPALSTAAPWIVCLALPVLCLPFIGIMAAIALPAYQNYVGRSQVAIVMKAMEPVRTTMMQAQQNGAPLSEQTLEPLKAQLLSNPYISAARLDGDGEIEVELSPRSIKRLQSRHLVWRKMADGQWLCGSEDMPPVFLPAQCRAMAMPAGVPDGSQQSQ